MLMAPEQTYFVRETLRLRLLDARVALLQHNGEVYQSDLNSAEAAVKQYFDARSPATQSWLKELAELKSLDIRMISDDVLRASQTAVRAYQDSVRTAMPQALPEAASSAAASQPAAKSDRVDKDEVADAHAGHDHGEVFLIGGGDHFFIAHGAAGLNERGGTRLGGRQEAVGERKKCVRGNDRAFGEGGSVACGLCCILRLACRDARTVDPAHLSSADTHRGSVFYIDDCI